VHTKRKLAPLADRRYVFCQRVAAGLSLRASAAGLGINPQRELTRPETIAAIADAKAAATHKAAARLEARERKNAPRAAYAPSASPTAPGPSADRITALSTNPNECFECRKALEPGEAIKSGMVWLCTTHAPAGDPLDDPNTLQSPEYYNRRSNALMAANFAARMIAGPLEPLETGTFTPDTGYRSDPREADREALAAQVREKRASTPRRSWLKGQQHE
jgi:hypothetical protein